MNRVEKNRDIIGMKSVLIGFALWLFITVITFVILRFSFFFTFFNVAGGISC